MKAIFIILAILSIIISLHIKQLVFLQNRTPKERIVSAKNKVCKKSSLIFDSEIAKSNLINMNPLIIQSIKLDQSHKSKLFNSINESKTTKASLRKKNSKRYKIEIINPKIAYKQSRCNRHDSEDEGNSNAGKFTIIITTERVDLKPKRNKDCKSICKATVFKSKNKKSKKKKRISIQLVSDFCINL